MATTVLGSPAMEKTSSRSREHQVFCGMSVLIAFSTRSRYQPPSFISMVRCSPAGSCCSSPRPRLPRAVAPTLIGGWGSRVLRLRLLSLRSVSWSRTNC